MALAQTPLYSWHVAQDARMVDFAGWSMPLFYDNGQYTSIVVEHNATRNAAGLFDISHMGRFRFDGPDACKFLDRLVTRRISNLSPGRVRYALVTNEEGGILDDVLVSHLQDAAGTSFYSMVVNASNREKIAHWIQDHLADVEEAGDEVEFSDLTEQTAMIAVQGPKALKLLNEMVNNDLAAMEYYTAQEADIEMHKGLISRTGYTGEDGFELIVPNAAAANIWATLLDAGEAEGALAAGLGCRDTLRLEAAMPLYGHELAEQINPYEAGLGFAVHLKDRTFPGRDALTKIKAGPLEKVRAGLELTGRRVPREGYSMMAGNRQIGKVTSGTFSPTLQKPIAMGYILPEMASPGTEVAVDIRGRLHPACIVELPFYRRQTKGN